MRTRLTLAAGLVSVGALLFAPAAGSSSQKLQFSAAFVAPTHTPRVGKAWRYAIYVRNLDGNPIQASAHQYVMLGTRRIDTVGWNKFKGVYRRTYYWPAVDRGKALTFQVNVVGPGGTKILKYAIRVQ